MQYPGLMEASGTKDTEQRWLLRRRCAATPSHGCSRHNKRIPGTAQLIAAACSVLHGFQHSINL